MYTAIHPFDGSRNSTEEGSARDIDEMTHGGGDGLNKGGLASSQISFALSGGNVLGQQQRAQTLQAVDVHLLRSLLAMHLAHSLPVKR